MRQAPNVTPPCTARHGVVTNNFLALGGHDYAMPAEQGRNGYDTAIDLSEVLALYLTDKAPFAPQIDGHIAR